MDHGSKGVWGNNSDPRYQIIMIELHQNRRIVFAYLGQEPEGRPLFAFFAKADSHHRVCLDGVAISTIVVAGVRGGRI